MPDIYHPDTNTYESVLTDREREYLNASLDQKVETVPHPRPRIIEYDIDDHIPYITSNGTILLFRKQQACQVLQQKTRQKRVHTKQSSSSATKTTLWTKLVDVWAVLRLWTHKLMSFLAPHGKKQKTKP